VNAHQQLWRQVPGADRKESQHTRSRSGSIWSVRALLLVQIAIFLVLMSLHFGELTGGHTRRAAGEAELVIAAVLSFSLVLTWTSPPWRYRAAAAAQWFATFGASVGLLAIALGVGSRTLLDVGLNIIVLLTLGAGLTVTSRSAGHQRA
jgi:hypothetical protein